MSTSSTSQRWASSKSFTHVKSEPLQELEAIQEEIGRFYKTPSGLFYPSVTTITGMLGKKAIMEWRARVGEEEANRVSTRAANRGTRMHKLCEDYINNQLVDSADILSYNMFSSIKPILDEHLDKVRMQEVPLYSDYLKVAGRVDCVAEWDGKLSVIDFKTSSSPKRRDWIQGYFMQASAYAVMYEELTGKPISRLVILVAVEHDSPQVFMEKRDDHIHGFIRLRETYRDKYGK